MNKIQLKNWYTWPICCPFCGKPEFDINAKYQEPDTQACQHLLYIKQRGEFVFSSKRFIDSEMSADLFENVITFEIDSVSDIIEVVFACFADELAYWGKEPTSPHIRRDIKCKD
ncbi:hypothetical protein [Desulfofustis glycolicus]|uniref:Uncharacterized protein n=1 Tax=Desulfofustis glycolicus DSM 9705 TaxID=1121409 RepID=A0A1M5YLW2_9BACT|nr:hypothetical protein [Desulfofustis glycolicus]SHI12941.1 hypothetical protein SAMN02745124_04192 [Desulfofustis glycolicus DSM 9705]